MKNESGGKFRVRVSVKHGDLRFASYPVAVGHYRDDSLVSAERYLDGRLDGRLARRLASGIYPEGAGDAEVILGGEENLPPGAVIIGLGDLGEISPATIRQGVMAGGLRLALMAAESPLSEGGRGWRGIGLSTLLIGTFGGYAVSVEEAVRATLLGVIGANRMLKTIPCGDSQSRLWDRVRIDHLELIELYEDIAIHAITEVHRLAASRQLELLEGEEIELSPERLVTVKGGRYQRPTNIYEQGWWRRIQITAAVETLPGGTVTDHDNGGGDPVRGVIELLCRKDDLRESQERLIESWLESAVSSPQQRSLLATILLDLLRREGRVRFENSSSRGLEFLVLTDRARVEASLHSTQREMVDHLIAEAIYSPAFDPRISTTLYELLLPNQLKEQTENVALVLDGEAAQYPWELLVDRAGNSEPLSVRNGMLRQFKTSDFRPDPQPSLGRFAFVLGDTLSGYDPLPGAREEAMAVGKALTEGGYEPTLCVAPDARDVFHELFAREYQILHLAAHGSYDPRHPDRCGVLLGDGLFLTSKEFVNLRTVPELVFLNCCHLGQIDRREEGRPQNQAPHRLAASVAEELIKMGTRAVVAAGWAVDDGAATTFATRLYASLTNGGTFGEAVLEARQETWKRHGNTNTWGAYQCYGSHSFRLSHRREDEYGVTGNATAGFYSRHDYLQAIREIAASDDIENPRLSSGLRKRLASLESQVPEDLRSGEMLAEIARGWATLGDKRKAVNLYRRAFARGDGSVPLRSVEQCANLECRLAEDIYKRSGGKGQETRIAELLESAQDRLETLAAVESDNPEPLALSARILKARALMAQSWKETARLLGEAASLYHQASELDQQGRLWTRTQALACRLLAGDVTLAELDRLSRDASRRFESIAEPDFWDHASVPDTALLSHLKKGDLPEQCEQLIAAYHQLLESRPSAIEFDSVRSQFGFLIGILSRRPRPSRQQRLTIESLGRIAKAIGK